MWEGYITAQKTEFASSRLAVTLHRAYGVAPRGRVRSYRARPARPPRRAAPPEMALSRLSGDEQGIILGQL